MLLENIKPFFWDINTDEFDPTQYPDYTIFRILEYGNERAVAWLKDLFSEAEIKRIIRTERRLSPKSARFWALVYGIPFDEVAALGKRESPGEFL